MYAKDRRFVQQHLPGARQILYFFDGFQQADGSLRNLPWWNFTDWVAIDDWKHGTRSPGKDGNSALLDIQLLLAYQKAANLELKTGMAAYAAIYQQKAAQLKKTIQQKYWDDRRKLYADRSEKDLFSQHT